MTEQLQKEAATLSEHETHVRECLAALAHPSITPATPKQPLPAALLLTLQNLRETTETERRLAERILQQAEQEDAGLQADMTAWEKARHEANRLELALQTALHHKDSAEQEAVRTERERCSLLEQYTALRQTVLQGLRPYGIESLAVDGWRPCSTACLNAVNAGYPGKSGVTSYSKNERAGTGVPASRFPASRYGERSG